MKSKSLKWAVNMECMREKRNTCFWWNNLKKKQNSENTKAKIEEKY